MEDLVVNMRRPYGYFREHYFCPAPSNAEKLCLLFAALSNMNSRMKPYLTADTPGGQPVPTAEAARRRTQAKKKLAEIGLGEQPDETCPGPSPSQQQHNITGGGSLPAGQLHLTCRLAPRFLGWWVAAAWLSWSPTCSEVSGQPRMRARATSSLALCEEACA